MTIERALHHYNMATQNLFTVNDLDDGEPVTEAVKAILSTAALAEAQGSKLVSRQVIALAILISEK